MHLRGARPGGLERERGLERRDDVGVAAGLERGDRGLERGVDLHRPRLASRAPRAPRARASTAARSRSAASLLRGVVALAGLEQLVGVPAPWRRPRRARRACAVASSARRTAASRSVDRAIARADQLARAALVQEVERAAAQQREDQVGDERVEVEPARALALVVDQRGDRLGELGDLGLRSCGSGAPGRRAGGAGRRAAPSRRHRPTRRPARRLVGLWAGAPRSWRVFVPRIAGQIKSRSRTLRRRRSAWYSAAAQDLSWARYEVR